MFRLRSEVLQEKQFQRQKRLLKIILSKSAPLSNAFDYKIAAILHHPLINPITVAKLAAADNLDLEKLEEPLSAQTKSAIKDALQKITVNNSMRFQLFVPRNFKINNDENRILSFKGIGLINEEQLNTSLDNFEAIYFENFVSERYLFEENFPFYVYLNTKFYMEKVPSIPNDWRPLLLELIEALDFNNYFVKLLFYHDFCTVHEVLYSTKCIPKYDVFNLKPAVFKTAALEKKNASISFWNNLKINSETSNVPPEHLDIFKIFPFKDGYFISADGRFHYLDVFRPDNQRAKLLMSEVCNSANINASIYNVAKTESVEDLLACAIYAENLQVQAIALLALNISSGPILSVQQHKIELPFTTDVFSWVKFVCTNKKLLFPPKDLKPFQKDYLELIQHISRTVSTKTQAAFACCMINVILINKRSSKRGR